jgi:hypothetical protein
MRTSIQLPQVTIAAMNTVISSGSVIVSQYATLPRMPRRRRRSHRVLALLDHLLLCMCGREK